MNHRLRTLQTLGFVLVVALQGILHLWMTARHNAQLMALTEAHNAQLMALTEAHNAQLMALTERYNAQLASQAAALGKNH